MMKNYVGSDDVDKKQDRGGGESINTFPVRKVSVPVNKDLVYKNGTANAKDSVVNEVRFEIAKGGLMKNDLAVLNIIAANNWKRPIYFTGDFGELGFGKYLRKDGLSYRFVPVENDAVNADWMMDKALNKFGFGNANVKGVYYDEENRRHLQSIRAAYAELGSYLAEKGRKEDAKKILEKVDKEMSQDNYPYGLVSRYNMHNRVSIVFMDACYKAGDTTLAKKVSNAVKKDLQQQIKYYNALSGNNADNMAQDKQTAESYLQGITQMEQMYNAALLPRPIEKLSGIKQPIDTAKP
jgi:hypothetical protein